MQSHRVKHYHICDSIREIQRLVSDINEREGYVVAEYEVLLSKTLSTRGLGFSNLHVGVTCASEGDDLHIRIHKDIDPVAVNVDDMEEFEEDEEFSQWINDIHDAVRFALGGFFDIAQGTASVGGRANMQGEGEALEWVVDLDLEML